MKYGYTEGRKSCEDYKYIYRGVDYSAVFDPFYYLQRNPDLAAYYGSNRMASLEHFVIFGMKEGRQGCAGFNVFAYRDNNADVCAAYGDALEGYYLHFINYGQHESRIASY